MRPYHLSCLLVLRRAFLRRRTLLLRRQLYAVVADACGLAKEELEDTLLLGAYSMDAGGELQLLADPTVRAGSAPPACLVGGGGAGCSLARLCASLARLCAHQARLSSIVEPRTRYGRNNSQMIMAYVYPSKAEGPRSGHVPVGVYHKYAQVARLVGLLL